MPPKTFYILYVELDDHRQAMECVIHWALINCNAVRCQVHTPACTLHTSAESVRKSAFCIKFSTKT